MKKTSVLIISAEASSVLYAQRILELWKKNGTEIDAYGVGSNDMEKMGFRRMGRSEEMAVVGMAEVIRHYSAIKKVFYDVLAEVDRNSPKVAVLLDYPGFNLRLAKELKQRGIPVVYYIAPQVWAWKQKRVHKIKAYCDKVLLLFPFEIEFFKKHEVPYEFVGNPLLDELKPEWTDEKWIMGERRRCGIQDDEIVLGIMPGSRHGELQQMFPMLLEVARRLSHKVSNLKILILCAPSFEKEELMPYLDKFKVNFILMKTEPFKMIAMTDMILGSSGTATLMVGLVEKPMVTMYKMKWLSGVLAKYMVKGIKFFNLCNMILDEEVSPERFQEKATVEEMERLVFELISNPDVYATQKRKLKEVRNRLGQSGVTERVVGILNTYIETK